MLAGTIRNILMFITMACHRYWSFKNKGPRVTILLDYNNFAWEHLCASEKYIDDSKISEFLRKGISYMKTEIFQYRWNMLQTEHNCVWLCYDSTNMNMDAEGIEMAEFGHAKDDEDRPQVNISCAVDLGACHREQAHWWYLNKMADLKWLMASRGLHHFIF